MNFLLRLALQEKKLDDSSRLDAVEIARPPNILLSLFPSGSGCGIISTPVQTVGKKEQVTFQNIESASRPTLSGRTAKMRKFWFISNGKKMFNKYGVPNHAN